MHSNLSHELLSAEAQKEVAPPTAPASDGHEPMDNLSIVVMSDPEAEQQLLAYFSLQDTLTKEALAYLSKAVSFLPKSYFKNST